MWQSIVESIKDTVGSDFSIADKQVLSGGDIHKAYKVSGNKDAYFVKLNTSDKLDLFLTEAKALDEIDSTQTIRVPKVIATGKSLQHAYIVLEYLSLSDDTANGWAHFGEQLAGLHLADSQGMFGWDDDNYIGTTNQYNSWNKKWCNFFAEQRIGYQLTLLAEKGHKLTDIEYFVETVKQIIAHRKPCASLLHGDLWRGNMAFCESRPVIYDPASYFGDHETDLAMTELFGCLPKDFYDAYHAHIPKTEQSEQRKQIYNLYHILNHCNLFGGHYHDSASSMINQILRY